MVEMYGPVRPAAHLMYGRRENADRTMHKCNGPTVRTYMCRTHTNTRPCRIFGNSIFNLRRQILENKFKFCEVEDTKKKQRFVFFKKKNKNYLTNVFACIREHNGVERCEINRGGGGDEDFLNNK